ncbi:uncharacterized protein C19orf57 homolog isoform X1 [Heterocephalus glaber]|uniref:Uncharacterized protein C19orf57 homolog isoform X1 n=3 Tax=Heterocephalus glaber TaxID=10181 RepID=A0AAX6QQJ5_HETGA|nr:uncharacterized protein C19orf57 homolog isoform X1 [Heterocephalus glaber]
MEHAQISPGRDRMSKRKKLRTAGQGIHPPKPPKNPRPGDSNGGSRSSKLGTLQHPNESEDISTPTTPTELSGQEPGPAVSSFSEETAAASLLEQLEKEASFFPDSQTSLGRFVPQFAKPGKIVTRKAKTMEEDTERRAVSLEALPNPSAPWQLEGSLGPRAQMPADNPHLEQSGQKPGTPVPGEGTGSCNSEMASQDPVSEQGTSTSDGGNLWSSGPERSQVPNDLAPKRNHPCSGAEGMKPARGAPQEGGAQNGTPEEGGGITNGLVSAPTLATLCVKTFPTPQDLPDPRETPTGAGRQAECSCGGPVCACLGSAVMENTSTDAPETEQRTLRVAGPGVQPDTQPPASPGKHTLQGCRSLAEETTGDRGEAEPEHEPPSDTLRNPEAFWAVVLGNQEPTRDAKNPGNPVPDVGPGVHQPGPAAHVLPSLAQLGDRQVAESGSQCLEGGCTGLSLALCALCPPEHRAATNGPLWEARAQQGSLEAPTDPPGPLQHSLDSLSQAGWPESLTMELDFLPDSQLRDALDAPDLEAPLEQDASTENESGLCWPCPSLSAGGGNRVPVVEAQPRIEDASDTVHGLIVELSNLNRLIMSAHRDLEAFKRLSSRKARPLPWPPKGAGAVSRGEQPWRDL